MAQTQTGEAGLKVSNAPSDGKYLQYKDDTDKLTWADVPAGVGGDTGVDFNDGVKARFGTDDDVSIEHNGTLFQIADKGLSGSSSMWFSTADGDGIIFSVNKGVGNVYIARFSETDGCRLYHATSQRLNTTATGVTITGDLDPAADSSHDLGSSSVRWQNGYFDTLYGDGSNLTGIASTSLDGCGYQNDQIISAGSYTIPSGKGMHSVGPITNNGTVTVEGRWVIS